MGQGPLPEEGTREGDGGVVLGRGADDAGAWLGRHKSASAGFYPAALAALAERGGDDDAGPSASRLSLDHGVGLRSQSLTNVMGQNLKRGLGRIREFVFSGSGHSNPGNFGDAEPPNMDP
jgi:hypothetical protein